MLIDMDEFEKVKKQFNECAPIFIALGDEVRQKLILDIAEGEASSENGINVTELSAKSKLSRPAISHHLKVLKDYGLIEPKKEGTQIFYKLTIQDNLQMVSELVSSISALFAKIYPVQTAC